jgi:hypothetical protein
MELTTTEKYDDVLILVLVSDNNQFYSCHGFNKGMDHMVLNVAPYRIFTKIQPWEIITKIPPYPTINEKKLP